eukprot:8721640-Pyramimonas_sp.AAC.1
MASGVTSYAGHREALLATSRWFFGVLLGPLGCLAGLLSGGSSGAAVARFVGPLVAASFASWAVWGRPSGASWA